MNRSPCVGFGLSTTESVNSCSSCTRNSNNTHFAALESHVDCLQTSLKMRFNPITTLLRSLKLTDVASSTSYHIFISWSKANSKVDNPYSVTFHKLDIHIEWYVAKHGSQNKNHKYIQSKETILHAHTTIPVLDSTMNIIRREPI